MNIKDKIEQLNKEGHIDAKSILVVRLYNGHKGDEVEVWEGNMNEECPYGDLECMDATFNKDVPSIVYLNIFTETLKDFVLSLARK